MPHYIHAQANVEDMLHAQAVHSAVALTKKRARAYATSPMLLETVYPGLSAATPETVIALARHLILSEQNCIVGAGGEISLINAKAVLLYGRAIYRASSLRA